MQTSGLILDIGKIVDLFFIQSLLHGAEVFNVLHTALDVFFHRILQRGNLGLQFIGIVGSFLSEGS